MRSRRDMLAAGAGLAAFLLVRPAAATPVAQQAAIRALTKGATAARGRVRLELPPLVENGNAVAVTVTVDSPMTEDDHVTAIALFNEKNPLPHMVTAHLGPRSGRAVLQTRVRLADSQTITAVAVMKDGSAWMDSVDVLVTLAACVEG